MATIKDFFVKQGVQTTTTAQLGVGSANFVQVAGAASGNSVVISALGSDTNIGLNVVTKGTGVFTVNGVQIGVPGGTNGQIQYNNNGIFGGIATTGSGNAVLATSPTVTSPTISGGTHTAITSLGLRNTGSGAFDLTIGANATMTAARSLTLNMGDANRTITLAGDITTAGGFTTAGANALTLTTTGVTNVTLPTAGTLATLAGVETLTNKSLTAAALSAATVSTTSNVTAGTNAQGQAVLPSDYNVITTAASNPSGVTLPAATIGRSITVVNKGANPINVYPATGGAIDALGLNAAINIPVNGIVEFQASSTTQWYSSANETVSGAAVVGNITGAAGSLSPGATINGTSFTGASAITITAAAPNAVTFNNGGAGAASGATYTGASAVTVSYNTVGAPSTTGTNASGTWGISISGTAATGTTVTLGGDDTATNSTYFPLFSTTTSGNQSPKISSTKYTYNPSTGTLSASAFTGAGTGLTGTAAALNIGGNAATATTATTANAVANAVTFNNSGAGAASGTTYNGSGAITVSANTLGAVPLAGGTMTGSLTLNSDPTQALHAATKQYVDATTTGLDVKGSVRATTTAALTVTYANGASGVGATLTNSGALAALVLDGVTLAANDRVLVKNQAAAFQNGIYTVTNAGSGAVAWVLTRSTDADTGTELTPGMFTFVEEGTTQGSTGWLMAGTGATTMGTTNLPYTQFSAAGTATAGQGLVQVGNVFNFASSSAYTVGSLFYANSTTSVGQLADVATGSVLLSGGVGTVPTWGDVGLTTHVTGTLPVGNGGTGATTFTAGYLKASGTSAFTTSATVPGTDVTGNISGNAAGLTSTLAVTSGGTGQSSALTQFGVVLANTTTAMTTTAAGASKQVLAGNGSALPTFQTLDLTYLPDAFVKKSVRVASTANQALSGGTSFPVIDGITVAAGDRVLLKDQTTTSQNGIYSVGGTATAWTFTRATDADISSEIAAAVVTPDTGTVNAAQLFTNNFKSTDTLNTTAMVWNTVLDSGNYTTYAPTKTGTGASGTWAISVTGNAATATSATSATNATNTTNVSITDDTTTAATHYVTFSASASGNNPQKVASTKFTFNPSTGVLTASGGFSGTATNATNVATTDDTATNATMYISFVSAASGNNGTKVSSSKLTYNPSTGTVAAPTFSGALSGTATNATNIGITDDTSTNAAMYVTFVSAASGNQANKVSSTKLMYNPSTGNLTSPSYSTSGSVTAATVVINTNAVQTSGTASVTTTTTTNVDTWSSTTYRSCRYTVQVADGTNYEMADILVIHDGTTPFITTFGNVFTSANSLGFFDATISGGIVTVSYTASAATSKVVKFSKTLFTV